MFLSYIAPLFSIWNKKEHMFNKMKRKKGAILKRNYHRHSNTCKHLSCNAALSPFELNTCKDEVMVVQHKKVMSNNIYGDQIL
jgi:hypothetical protein